MESVDNKSGLWATCEKWFWRLSLTFSMAVFFFGLGFAVSYFKIFPYQVIREATIAGKAISYDVEKPVIIDEKALDDVSTKWHEEQTDSQTEAILYLAGGYFPNFNPSGTIASIVDRQGTVLHQWTNDPQLWSDTAKTTRVLGISGTINPVAVHLFENGDLLVSYHGQNTFPFGVGLAKFDKNSKLLWKRENYCHHNFSVSEDGKIYAPSVEIVDNEVKIGSTFFQISSPTGKIYRDQILVLDSEGNELSRIDILDALIKSGWSCLFNNVHEVSDDPTHLNDVQLVSAEFAKQADWLQPGDMIISLRNLNCIAILDKHTELVKWISSGAVSGQHAPRIHDKGILVLDNLGGNTSLGMSQLVDLSLDRGLPRVIYPTKEQLPPELMETADCGYIDLSRDGKRALVSITHAGTIWEINLQSGKLNWELVAGVQGALNSRLKVGCAKYVNGPKFW